MKRIAEDEITRVKRDTDMIALIQSRGVKLTRHGANWTGFCPFHKDENTPNLVVTPAKGLFRCMASCCGKAGNVIQFVQWFDGVSFRHAFDLLDNGGRAAFENSTEVKKSTIPKLPCPLETTADEAKLMQQVIDFYHARCVQVSPVRDYLKERGFGGDRLLEMMKQFRIGYADRSLGLRLPLKNRAEGKTLRENLVNLGVYRKSGHEHLNGCVVVPIDDEKGNVKQLYGRRIDPRTAKEKRHLYLAKPLAGVFNLEAFKSREIILTESIIDALTFWRAGMENVTCTFGTVNFTEELFTAIKAHKIESVRLAFDADEAGQKALKTVTHRLESIGVACYEVKFPWGSDANEYALNQGAEALKSAVRSALFLGAGAPISSNNKAAKLVAEEVGVGAEGGNPALCSKSAGVAKKENISASAELPELPQPTLTQVGDYHEYDLGNRVYRVGGLHKNNSLEVLRITLRVTSEGLIHVDSLDLYRDGERRKFTDRASEETMLEKELIKRDLGKLLLALEQEQEKRLNAEPEAAEQEALSESEHAEALKFLKAPKLLERIAESYDAAGLVGEATNKLAAYLACVSRKLRRPLAVIIQSTSAAGKSTLMEAVLSFFPHEEQIKYSAMTGQSLYYLGESNLKHKILAIVEEEGAEKASYALKLLQSEGELTIASTGKDPHSGRMETQEYHVEGPVAIVFTTTSIDIDEELMNRCLILTVDESREQTEKIHELQRLARTPEGIIAAEERKEVVKLMQNAQRLIKPMKIANPYARFLTFTNARTRTRRDHEKYLTLIDTIALLHQHQRELVKHRVGEREIEMLPVALEDIEAANKIAPEVLGRSLDELPPQTSRLLGYIKELVRTKMKATPRLDQNVTFFSRRELRELSGWSEFQVRMHMERLEQMEYVHRSQGRQGSRCTYELLVNAHEKAKGYQINLIDVEKLRDKRAG